MAPVTTRRSADEEEEYLDAEAVEELAKEAEAAAPAAPAPAVSDSRRRRQMKRGIVVEAEPSTSAVSEKKGRPTPSQREEAAPARNPLVRFANNVREYWRETRAELAKVAWPTREEIRRLTYIVLVVTIASSIFLGAISFLFSVLVTQLASADATFAFIIAVALIIVVSGLWLARDRLFPPRIE